MSNIYIKLKVFTVDAYPAELSAKLYDASGAEVADIAIPAAGEEAFFLLPGLTSASVVTDYQVVFSDSWGDGSFTNTDPLNDSVIEIGVAPLDGDPVAKAEYVLSDGDINHLTSTMSTGESGYVATFSIENAETMSISGAIGGIVAVSPKRQRTRVKAEYQINNASDSAHADHHFVQTDGKAWMATNYWPSNVNGREVVNSGFVVQRVAQTIGLPAMALEEQVVDQWTADQRYLQDAEDLIAAAKGVDSLIANLEDSIQLAGFELTEGAWAAPEGASYIAQGATISAALQDLDEGLDTHVTDLATAGVGKGANMIKVAAESGEHVEMSGVAILDGSTVQQVIAEFVSILDVIKADETIPGSIKQLVDNNVAEVLTGASGDQLAASLQAIADLYNEINVADDQDLTTFVQNMGDVMGELINDIRDGHEKDGEYGTFAKINSSLGTKTLLEVSEEASTFVQAINEVNLHADNAALSLKAEYDFASGPYAHAGRTYITNGSTVDGALSLLDKTVQDNFEAMGLQLDGQRQDDAASRYLQGEKVVEQAFVKLDEAAKNLEDSISSAHDMASGPWSAPLAANYMGGMKIAAALAKADSLAKKLELSIQANGEFDLDAQERWGASAGDYIVQGATIAASLGKLDNSLQVSMTSMGLELDGRIQFDLETEDRPPMSYIGEETEVKSALRSLDSFMAVHLSTMGLDVHANTSFILDRLQVEGEFGLESMNFHTAITRLAVDMTDVEGRAQDIEDALNVVEGAAALIRKGDVEREWFTADEGQSVFSVATAAHAGTVEVYRNGLYMRRGVNYDFTISGDGLIVTLASGQECDADDEICVAFVKKTSSALIA